MQRSTNKRPSMKDVADLAGVSRTTVSFVLNGKSEANIPKKTQERILAAVDTLGYRPNAIARGLRAQQTQTIGFISDVIGTTPYAGQILHGAQGLAWEEGNLLLSINTNRNPALKEAAVTKLLERQVDGIIYATMYHRLAEPPAALREVPAVLLDCFVEDRSLPSVVPDEFQGGYTATKHLLDQGHRRVGLINNIDAIPATKGRYAGYKRALAEHNISLDSDIVIQGVVPDIGYEATIELMRQPNPPTALFCFHDRTAVEAYKPTLDGGSFLSFWSMRTGCGASEDLL
ncbi:MAG: LacI family DNA-binding transcriptional regulator, partial [Chloroflexota bacterium]